MVTRFAPRGSGAARGRGASVRDALAQAGIDRRSPMFSRMERMLGRWNRAGIRLAFELLFEADYAGKSGRRVPRPAFEECLLRIAKLAASAEKR